MDMASGWRNLLAAPLSVQLARFGVVGIAATATHYLVATGLAAAVNAYAANLGGYLAAVGLSYHGHKHWTFRDRSRTGSTPRPWLRFLVVSLSALGLSEWVLHLGLGVLALPPLVALLLAVLTVPPATFMAARLWVFRPGG